MREIWISAGYERFALEGLAGLRVEPLARALGKSKSSFYHLFLDQESFVAALLQRHRERAAGISAQIAACPRMVPELLELFLALKTDILFQRQLRIARQQAGFRACFEQAHQPIEAALLGLWAEALQLQAQPRLAALLLHLVVDNFYLRVTAANLHYDWLLDYLREIRYLVAALRQ